MPDLQRVIVNVCVDVKWQFCYLRLTANKLNPEKEGVISVNGPLSMCHNVERRGSQYHVLSSCILRTGPDAGKTLSMFLLHKHHIKSREGRLRKCFNLGS